MHLRGSTMFLLFFKLNSNYLLKDLMCDMVA